MDNYYERTDEGTRGDINLARVSADVRTFTDNDEGPSGYFRIKTAFTNFDAAAGSTFPDYNTALMADYDGKTGIGTSFHYSNSGADTFPIRRLEVYENQKNQSAPRDPQFRITQKYNEFFTDFPYLKNLLKK